MTIKLVPANGTYTDAIFPLSGVTVVGTQPVLGDNSDATYLEAGPNAGGPTIGLDTLDNYTAGDPIELHVRLQVLVDTTDPDDDWRIEMFLSTTAAEGDEFAGFSDGSTSGFAFQISSSAANAIVEQVVPLSLGAWAPTTTGDVVAALEAGAYLLFNSFRWVDGASEPLLRLYEAWIQVGRRTAAPPPLRRYPRADGYGIGPTRHYPPPKSRRGAGGIR